jgi:hypothetical protein
MQDAAVDPDWQIRTACTHGARVIELDPASLSRPSVTHSKSKR